MNTASRRIIRETDHVRNAERFLGGRLEDTLKPYLNETGTMSDLASAIGVQKATVNYWIMRLGIKYARVAYDESEEVRVYSREEAETADAAIESGLAAEQLESIDRATYDAFTEFQQSDRHATADYNLTARDIELLETVKEVGERVRDISDDADFPECLKAAIELSEQGIDPAVLQKLTRSDIQTLAHLKSIGAKKRDVINLDSDSIDHLRNFEDKGLRLEDFADFNIRRLRALKRAGHAGLDLEQVAALTPEDLDLLDAIRQAGWNDESKLRADLNLLEAVRKAGLDSQTKLDAWKTLTNSSSGQPVNGR